MLDRVAIQLQQQRILVRADVEEASPEAGTLRSQEDFVASGGDDVRVIPRPRLAPVSEAALAEALDHEMEATGEKQDNAHMAGFHTEGQKQLEHLESHKESVEEDEEPRCGLAADQVVNELEEGSDGERERVHELLADVPEEKLSAAHAMVSNQVHHGRPAASLQQIRHPGADVLSPVTMEAIPYLEPMGLCERGIGPLPVEF